MNDYHKDLFKTTDLVLAAALITLNKELLEMDRLSGTQFAFVFNILDNGIEQDFINGRLVVEPMRFSNNMKLLKSKIHARLRG